MSSSWAPEPLTFGECGECPYRARGTVEICWKCASRVVAPVPRKRCAICEQALAAEACGNPICNFRDRYFDRNYSIAMHEGPLKKAISRYKYKGGWGWAGVFARVLVGFLEKNRVELSRFDLICASPTFVDPELGRERDHTRDVLVEAAKIAERDWLFDIEGVAVIRKLKATEPLVNKTWKERHEIAEKQLRPAIQVTEARRTRGKHILVYDDVFTDGHTLNEVARCLKLDGAATEVVGISLARQPFKG